MRTFIAINLPDGVKRHVAYFSGKLRDVYKRQNITWVDYGILHITLVFLGEIAPAEVDTARELAKEVVAKYRGKRFGLEFYKYDALPSARSPRVLIIRGRNYSDGQPSSDPERPGPPPRQSQAPLHNLQRDIHNALVNEGFVLDNKVWQPHITLGRVKDRGAKLNLEKFKFEPITFPIITVDLMSSVLTSSGPRYSIVESYKL